MFILGFLDDIKDLFSSIGKLWDAINGIKKRIDALEGFNLQSITNTITGLVDDVKGLTNLDLPAAINSLQDLTAQVGDILPFDPTSILDTIGGIEAFIRDLEIPTIPTVDDLKDQILSLISDNLELILDRVA